MSDSVLDDTTPLPTPVPPVQPPSPVAAQPGNPTLIMDAQALLTLLQAVESGTFNLAFAGHEALRAAHQLGVKALQDFKLLVESKGN